MAAHVAFETARYTDDQAIVRHISGDDGTCGDEGVTAKGDAANNRGIGSDGGTSADPGFLIKGAADDLGAGVGDVGENAGGAEENVVLDGGAGVDGDVVLDFDVVADENAVGDHGVLTEGAALADFGTAANVGKVPDAGVIADLGPGIDDGGGMRLVGGHDAGWGLGGGLFEDFDDGNAVESVGAGRLAVGDAVDEMLKLKGERLDGAFEEEFGRGFVFDQIGVDELAVEHDFFCVLIIDEHATATDDAKAAGVLGPEPGGVQGGFDVVGEVEVKIDVVSNEGLEPSMSVAGDVERGGTDEMEEDGDVMNAEGPEGVLSTAGAAEFSAFEVQGEEGAEVAGAEVISDETDSGMVEQKVADHEHALAFLCDAVEFLSFF